jgi:UDP-N-acetylmuramyl tripeptide synthase
VQLPPTGSEAGQPKVFVDYAHTPDALENVLLTLRALGPQRLIVVFGCGGDRDRGKRPLMGAVAAKLADVLLVTSDNPRSEPPQSIMAEIEQGIVQERLPRLAAELLLQERGRQGYAMIEERAEAIRIAIRGARAGDVVLVSGKGHECYQIIGNSKLFFDDRQQAREQLEMAGQAA